MSFYQCACVYLSIFNRWNYCPSDLYSSRFIDHFISTLGSLPSLKELCITFKENDLRPNFELRPDFSLDPISNLLSISITWNAKVPLLPHTVHEISKLISRSATLESFSLCINSTSLWGEGSPPPSFGNLFDSLASLPPNVCLKLKQIKLLHVSVTAHDFDTHSRHFKSLETLEVLSGGGSVLCTTGIAKICQWLERERIHLKHFAAETIHPPEILQYLSSFSGLEYLELHPIDSEDDSDEFVERFFSSVLPNHRSTLESLKLGTHVPTAWTKFTDKCLEQIERCTSLRKFSCWICCQTPNGGFTDTNIVSCL